MAAANDLPSTVYATSYLLTQTRGGADFDPPAHFLRAPLDVDQVGATCFRVRLSGSTRLFGLAKERARFMGVGWAELLPPRPNGRQYVYTSNGAGLRRRPSPAANAGVGRDEA